MKQSIVSTNAIKKVFHDEIINLFKCIKINVSS